MKKFVNLTGHNINLRDYIIPGNKDQIARIQDRFGEFDSNFVCSVHYDTLVGLPEPEEETLFIVSPIVLAFAKSQGRTDCVAPASGHPLTVKNEKGHIISIPGFVS